MTADNPSRTYPRLTFTKPMPYGYVYLGMRIDPPRRTPFVRSSTKRRDVLQECKRQAHELDTLAEVVAVTVYEAVVIPPVKRSPRFDVIALVQTTSPEAIPAVQTTEAYKRLELHADLVMAARNVRRIGDVDHPRSEAFLFNHFTAADPERALGTLEEIAGWFIHQAGVAASALLQPTGEGAYAFVTHIRLPGGPIQFLLRLAKPSFWTFVVRRLNANQIGFAPVICTPV
jgi:hypothetical protein